MTISSKRLIFAGALIVFIATAVAIWDYTIDDAFITFRYAENLANGHGLVFNPGDKPVEGYSNFLWMLLLSNLYKIGLPTPETAKILGLILMAAAGAIWYFSYEKSEEGWLWLVGPLFLISPVTPFWGLSGLELGLHAVLVAATVISFQRQSWIAPFLLPLLILNRPEGFIIVFVLLAANGTSDYFRHCLNMKHLMTGAVIAGATILFLTISRLAVFGYPLPNTFYAKMHHNAMAGFLELGRMMILFLPLALGMSWGVLKACLRPFESVRLMMFLVLIAVQAVLSSRVDPVMNFLFRYLVAFLPLLIAVSIDSLPRMSSKAFVASTAAVIVITLLMPWPGVLDNVRKARDIRAAQWAVVDWLRPQPDSTTVSMTDMGLIPYYSGKKFFDTFGLINEDIAHVGFIPRKEFLRLPDYFIMVGYRQGPSAKVSFWRERLIGYNDVFSKIYQYRTVFTAPGADPSDSTGYNYLVFERKADAQKMIKVLEDSGKL